MLLKEELRDTIHRRMEGFWSFQSDFLLGEISPDALICRYNKLIFF